MANKPLKSIKFPGLSDTYTVPQFDTATGGMGTAGTIPDSKAVKDELDDVKDSLSDLGLSVVDGKLCQTFTE